MTTRRSSDARPRPASGAGVKGRPVWRWLLVLTFIAAPASSLADDDQPSLDDLLDLAPPTVVEPDAAPDATGPADAAEDEAEPSSDGVIDVDPDAVRDASDAFRSSIREMKDAGERLTQSRDVSIRTQRIQESVLRKLEQVIAAAESQEPSSSNSSGQGGSPSENQDTGSANNAAQESQASANEPANGAQPGQEPDATGGASSQGDAGADGDTRTDDEGALAETRAEWGALPPRLRDELLEGVREHYSPVYRELTESYYRRLAEETSE